ncbi:hypothetical protein [Loktanella sp. M215]|uniref:hypothetical protein n=1 Tax=Loktanella sp. M215 TaxID=2675431 RepID=UPI001F3DC7EC|nr:hypothetical protein [Loktanella sp. M215]MCF7700458.1 hypothetical protein [Loktanella sp. M215]
MTQRLPHNLLAALALVIMPVSTSAQCAMAITGAGCGGAFGLGQSGAKTIKAPAPPPPLVAVGDTLERGTYSMVMDATWYGLPPAQDGWVYFRIGRDVFRVDYVTLEVLENVTAQAGRNWP